MAISVINVDGTTYTIQDNRISALPLPVSQGGTGATLAEDALSNLLGTTPIVIADGVDYGNDRKVLVVPTDDEKDGSRAYGKLVLASDALTAWGYDSHDDLYSRARFYKNRMFMQGYTTSATSPTVLRTMNVDIRNGASTTTLGCGSIYLYNGQATLVNGITPTEDGGLNGKYSVQIYTGSSDGTNSAGTMNLYDPYDQPGKINNVTYSGVHIGEYLPGTTTTYYGTSLYNRSLTMRAPYTVDGSTTAVSTVSLGDGRFTLRDKLGNDVAVLSVNRSSDNDPGSGLLTCYKYSPSYIGGLSVHGATTVSSTLGELTSYYDETGMSVRRGTGAGSNTALKLFADSTGSSLSLYTTGATETVYLTSGQSYGGSLILRDASGSGRVSLDQDELSFKNASGTVTASYPSGITNTNLSIPAVYGSRCTVTSGGVYRVGPMNIVNIDITSATTASNSPTMLTVASSYNPDKDIALQCIDITSGTNTVDAVVPCRLNTNGNIYLQSATTNHKYAISGVYMSTI